ncbi:Holliday junction branch migration protein RuvA [Lagierella sp.]|uniref:Holliday junction branch migration protein RuvA n=1 Tax=Lagierella sp. TaxID=2849657 RepID=UPI002620411F|nr:Holliday junction branch migration protein RuvA [Lagierella sp.]
MYAYIIGDVKAIYEDEIIVENSGIGYRIYTTASTIAELNTYETFKLYTEYIVREDGVFLYGFSSEEELNLFKELIKVSSIGPKVAISLLSTLNTNDIKYAIHTNDVELLTKAPGIGKKTAGRIILELKDKLAKDYHVPDSDSNLVDKDEDRVFAIEALINLGYLKNDVEKVLGQIDPSLRLEDKIKMAMKNLESKR